MTCMAMVCQSFPTFTNHKNKKQQQKTKKTTTATATTTTTKKKKINKKKQQQPQQHKTSKMETEKCFLSCVFPVDLMS